MWNLKSVSKERLGDGVKEPYHIYKDGDCPCVSCDSWRARQVVQGSLVKGYNLVNVHSGGETCIWRPGDPVLWDVRMQRDQLALVIQRHFHGSLPEIQLDCVKIVMVGGGGFWITSARWLLVVAPPGDK